MEKNIEQNVTQNQTSNLTQPEIVDNVKVENKPEQKSSVSSNKKPLTPYQKYKNSRNQNGKKYFDFYDDIKVYTHKIWDW